MALGATASEAGPLAPLRVALQQAIPNAASWTPPSLVSVAAGLLLLAGLSRLGRAAPVPGSGAPPGCGSVSRPRSPGRCPQRPEGTSAWRWCPVRRAWWPGSPGSAFPAWDLLLVLGVLAGGWLAARQNGPVALSAPSRPHS